MDIQALVKFYIPLQEEYEVNTGEIIQMRSNEYAAEIYVSVFLAAESENTIELTHDSVHND